MTRTFSHHAGAKQIFGGVSFFFLLFSFLLSGGALLRGLSGADEWILLGIGLLFGLLGLRLLLFGLFGQLKLTGERLIIPTLLGQRSYRYADIAGLGRFEAPIIQRGLTGNLIRRRVGGSAATNLYLRLESGQRQRHILSTFDQSRQILKLLSQKTGRSIQRLDAQRLADWR